MKKSTIMWIGIAALVIAGGVYWYVQGGPGEEGAEGSAAQQAEHSVGAPTSAGTEYVAGNLLLGTNGNTKNGTYLIGFNGQTLYSFDKDTAVASNCTGTCASVWPPYVVPNTSVLKNVQSGIPGNVGTIARADGTLQVTYKGKPLYFYANDATGSDTKGNGVNGLWHIVSP